MYQLSDKLEKAVTNHNPAGFHQIETSNVARKKMGTFQFLICLKYTLLLILLLFMYFQLSFKSTYASETSDEILVASASSLTNALEEIGDVYRSRTGIKVIFNFSASGVLQKQIERGAPVDIFASAGEKQMDTLESKGLIDDKTRMNFSTNNLVLVLPKSSKFNFKSFSDLDNPDLLRLAVGNPKTAPVGQYTKESLISLNLWDKLEPKLIFAENVRQVLDYIIRGEVDAAIVYSSDVMTAKDKIKKV
ncbi:MAG: molybdate ABC transporter substrate-binding protein, partial [Thermodesulfobacteriota bacterium]